MRNWAAILVILAEILYGSFALAADCGNDPNAARIREFVHRSYIHGIPFSQGSQFRSNHDVETLQCLLNDPEEEFYWRNIATALGMSGNPHATQPLINFLESGDDTLSRDSFAGKSAALLALGYLAPSDETAMTYLRASSNPEVWEKRGVKWTSPYTPSKEERDSDLSKHAILALGLTGNPSAAEFLVGLQRGEPVRLTPEFHNVIVEALKTNEKVQRSGTAAYDERR